MAEAHSGFLSQVSIVFEQRLRAFRTGKGWKSFVSVAIIAVLIAMVMGEDTFVRYNDTRNGSFALVCACIWIGIFSSIRSICRERDIVKHEHRTGLRMSSYVLAHWLYEAMLCLADAAIVTLVVYLFTADHFLEEGVLLPPLLELYITFFLITFSADALGLLISAIVHDENTAMTVMPFALIIQLVMSGMIFELEGLPDLISYLTISRWGLDAICATSHVNEMYETFFQPELALDEYAATASNLTWLWGILLLFAAAYAVLSVIILELSIDR